MTAFLASLDLEGERRSARRVETWIFIRMMVILVVVIGAVVVRSLLL